MKPNGADIPKLMEHLPIDDRGYPVPYFVPMVNGKPDFRFQDSRKKKVCRDFLKCSVCGNRLFAKSFWFITGPMGFHNATVSDEPMHEDCARYSLAVCPHLFFLKAERRETNVPAAAVKNPNVLLGKPEHIFLIKADKIWYFDEMHTRFRIVEFFAFKYVENKLVPIT